ncbi:MAG: hypothetical protein GVY13_08525 [Alphaproteobacteria bacterium]|jgi:hypothetical protein|nr:hypothetical protein [Alphaproteobacteria bacterium]
MTGTGVDQPTSSDEAERRHRECLDLDRQHHDDYVSRIEKMHSEFLHLGKLQKNILIGEVVVIVLVAAITVYVAIDNVLYMGEKNTERQVRENTVEFVQMLNDNLLDHYLNVRRAMSQAEAQVAIPISEDVQEARSPQHQRNIYGQQLNSFVRSSDDIEESIVVIGTHLDNMARCVEAELCNGQVLAQWTSEYYYDFWSYFRFYVQCQRLENSANQVYRDYWQSSEIFLAGPAVDHLAQRGRFEERPKPLFEARIDPQYCQLESNSQT